MWRFIITIVFLILSVWVGIKVSADPGLAIFTYQNWSVEMSLWFAVLTLMILLVSAYWLAKLVATIDQSILQFKSWWQLQRFKRAFNKTQKGLLALLEEEWLRAENLLLNSQAKTDLMNLLGAAIASHQQKKYQKRDHYFQHAYQLFPKAHLSVAIMDAKLHMEAKQYDVAQTILDRIYKKAPYHPAVLKLLERLYAHQGEFEKILELIPSLRKARMLNKLEAQKLTYNMHYELFCAKIKNAKNARAVDVLWEALPKKLHSESRFLLEYVKNLYPYTEAHEELAHQIIKLSKQEWLPALIKYYGQLKTPNVKNQLAEAEKWLAHHPKDPTLLLTLARLSRRCQLWGRARNFLTEGMKLTDNVVYHFEFAELLTELGETDLALHHYRTGLVIATQK